MSHTSPIIGMFSRMRQTKQDATQQSNKAVHRPWYAAVARTGYAAKGVVYLIIGLLALEAAVHAGGTTTDQRGALLTLYAQPFGKFLLIIVTLGLLAYAATSFVNAVLDPERQGHDAKNTLKRVGYAIVGASYLGLAISALQFVLFAHSIGKSSNTSTQDWTARLLQAPFGVFLVTLLGIIVAIVAVALGYEGVSGHFKRHFEVQKMAPTTQKALTILGYAGMLSQAVVFLIVAIFLEIAAWRHSPGQAKGLGGALSALAQQPFGPWLLGLVALGLIAYGAYSVFEARYRRVAA